MMNKSKHNFPTGGKQVCSLLFFAITSISFSSGAMAIEPSDGLSFETMLDSAEYYSSHKQWDDAERMTVMALRLKPANKTNWFLWSNLAEIRRNLNDKEGALTAYDIGLSLQPTSAEMLSGRANLLIEERRLEDALEDLNLLLKNDSTAEWPRMIRGMVLLDMGDHQRAEDDFITLKNHYPNNRQAYNGLASIRATEGKLEEAIKLYSQSLSIEPDKEIFFYKVLLQAENGHLTEAAETLRDAMKIYPRNGNLFIMRAYLHKLNFQNDEAEIALKLAKEYGADSHLIENIFPKNVISKGKK
ncbi:MAG: tetratricopeptide repeat protein [Muribaculaceae bacterium]|nr:tetratricopeptide repeat protein [Muribaculaceae bacterium]